MKIKTTTTCTEIECTAEELRQSNTLSDSFANFLRHVFNGGEAVGESEEDEVGDG